MSWFAIEGDCIDQLAYCEPDWYDAIVTDPPYALSFMGKSWDSFGAGGYQSWCQLWAAECLRVLKPGGHMLAFGGTRTYHRLACAIEDAGFEIRDSLHWIYGSGFPAGSLDISKVIDKRAGAEREVVPGKTGHHIGYFDHDGHSGATQDGMRYAARYQCTAPATTEAKQWQGWGTKLKPAHEPIILARKSVEGTVTSNVLEHGTGGINVDGCRIGTDVRHNPGASNNALTNAAPMNASPEAASFEGSTVTGRWPANIILGDGDELGEASRFFYHAKASAKERPAAEGVTAHPTVKPLALVCWLVRLITPPGGTVLDPFAGTGTTAEACLLEGFDCVLIERDPDYIKLINARMNNSIQETDKAN